MSRSYNVIEETEDGDVILNADLDLCEAEVLLCRALNDGCDAYITDFKPGDKGVDD